VAPGGAALAGKGRSDCETSGFVAAAAPTGDFGVDVHIDTGVLGLSSAQLLVIVQDLFIAPVWMALVWAVHALVVMLEWCFTIDLLERGSVAGGVASGLRQMQSTITMPWLVTATSIAAVLCAYHGLIRRRVAESLTQALLVLAMTVVAIWLALDPTGTVGALGEWANDAGLGTLAVSAGASPAEPARALADGMGLVYETAVEVPWCYLEFGDVDWCRSPSRLDPQLRSAALALAKSELGEAGCVAQVPAAATSCHSDSDTDAKALERSARLLRGARSNGAIFLALPPNGPARNAINDPRSLLRAICRSDSATSCRGAAAAPAEFRTNGGTWARVGGLLLIVAGVLGMLLLLGFLALRLLGSAIFSLLYLLLAPLAALAPSLGETGRAVFRKWAAQLFGAVVSKLLFAFMLGVVLAVLGILEHLEGLGWWTRWLLMSAFWWGVFARRHQILQLAHSAEHDRGTGRPRSVLRRVSDRFDAGTRAYGRARATRERLRKRAPEIGRGDRGVAAPVRRGPRAKEVEMKPAGSGAGRRPDRSRIVGRDSRGAEDSRGPLAGPRLENLADQQASALAVGNRRRALRLSQRAERVEDEVRLGAEREGVERTTTAAASGERELRREQFLHAQARLPAGRADSAGSKEGVRSYAALAGIAGYGRHEYGRLAPVEQRAVRVEIDRELAQRRDGRSVVRRGTPTAADGTRSGLTDKGGSLLDAGGDSTSPRPVRERRSESSVMRDARDVAARRKRQLGGDRP
jgi:hypothetical protein